MEQSIWARPKLEIWRDLEEGECNRVLHRQLSLEGAKDLGQPFWSIFAKGYLTKISILDRHIA